MDDVRTRIEKLREASAEIRADLERREADPFLQHDILLAKDRQAIERARVVYKSIENAKVDCAQTSVDAISSSNDTMVTGDDEPIFTDAQLDVLAEGLAEFRTEMRNEIATAVAPLAERIVRLEGQVRTLLQIIAGGDGNRTLDAPKRLQLAKS
jgi:hypothetical protein